METKIVGGIRVSAYLVPNPDFIPVGEYKRTELDDYKDSVDFLITSCGKRYEIVFKHPTMLKTGRSITAIGERKGCAYLVTEKALSELKKEYTWATDF